MNPDGRRIRIRLGLFSGDITAAVVGTKMKRMTMIGDTVRHGGAGYLKGRALTVWSEPREGRGEGDGLCGLGRRGGL